MAEYFLDLNRERTMEGLKAALARDRKGGRRKKLSDADLAAARAMMKDHTISVAEIARRLGVTRTTFYLNALCQRCHMLHDREEHHRQRRLTLRMRKALADLFSGPYRF